MLMMTYMQLNNFSVEINIFLKITVQNLLLNSYYFRLYLVKPIAQISMYYLLMEYNITQEQTTKKKKSISLLSQFFFKNGNSKLYGYKKLLDFRSETSDNSETSFSFYFQQRPSISEKQMMPTNQ